MKFSLRSLFIASLFVSSFQVQLTAAPTSLEEVSFNASFRLTASSQEGDEAKLPDVAPTAPRTWVGYLASFRAPSLNSVTTMAGNTLYTSAVYGLGLVTGVSHEDLKETGFSAVWNKSKRSRIVASTAALGATIAAILGYRNRESLRNFSKSCVQTAAGMCAVAARSSWEVGTQVVGQSRVLANAVGTRAFDAARVVGHAMQNEPVATTVGGALALEGLRRRQLAGEVGPNASRVRLLEDNFKGLGNKVGGLETSVTQLSSRDEQISSDVTNIARSVMALRIAGAAPQPEPAAAPQAEPVAGGQPEPVAGGQAEPVAGGQAELAGY